MKREEDSFIAAMLDNPHDEYLRLVFADWLEERGDVRGELLRLTHTLTQAIDVPHRAELEKRLQALVDDGVQAVGPFCTNSLGMRFAWIPPGSFLMGSPVSEQEDIRKQYGKQAGDWAAQEIQHRVTLTQGFFLGVHQVTQAQWQAVMSTHPSEFKGDDLPVESVSWLDAVEFCNTLSTQESKKPCYNRVGDDIEFVGSDGYCLPTEAEWEYACRAGSSSAYCFGNEVAKLGEYAWHYNNAAVTPHPVGQKKANALGVFDMHGNVWEWCQDWHAQDYYSKSPSKDPLGAQQGEFRVMRGGSWNDNPEYCRSAFRNCYSPGDRYSNNGFRVVMRLSPRTS